MPINVVFGLYFSRYLMSTRFDHYMIGYGEGNNLVEFGGNPLRVWDKHFPQITCHLSSKRVFDASWPCFAKTERVL